MSATEINFAWAGFLTAMLSNFAFVFRNIKSKQAQKDIGAPRRAGPHRSAAFACMVPFFPPPLSPWGISPPHAALLCASYPAAPLASSPRLACAGLQGINLYAWMSILGTAILLPVSLAMEGPQLQAGCAPALASARSHSPRLGPKASAPSQRGCAALGWATHRSACDKTLTE